MSEKNRDNKNRWRNVTIAFRMSPEENEELDLRVKLCGYQTRQEYIIESVLHQKVTAVGNPLMLVQFRKQLRGIEEELKRLTILEDADEELFTPIRTMLEILNAFAEERNYERRKKKKQQGSCESCMYYEYDEDYECYVCEVNLDEDEMARFMEDRFYDCPYYRLGDEYIIVRKQM